MPWKDGRYRSRGRTVVFVSHNMSAVNRLCSAALLLDGGKVRARGNVHDITSLYLHGRGLSPAEREWTDLSSAPGDSVARLNKVSVLQDGHVRGTVDITRPVVIQMQYTCLYGGSHLMPVFSFFDDQGQIAFVSADFTRAAQGNEHSSGLHECRCEIPGNLLSEGTLFVAAEVCTSHPYYTMHFLEREAVSFNVTDSGEPGSVRSGWGRTILGVVRPQCSWEREFRGEASDQ